MGEQLMGPGRGRVAGGATSGERTLPLPCFIRLFPAETAALLTQAWQGRHGGAHWEGRGDGKAGRVVSLSAFHLPYQALVACEAACRKHSYEFLMNDFK